MEVLLACLLALFVIDAVKPKFFIDTLARIGSWLARMASPMSSFLAQAWARDRLAVAGVGSAVVAFLLWAWPSPWPSPWAWEWWHGFFYFGPWFPTERLPAAAAFLALSFILLLLRRR